MATYNSPAVQYVQPIAYHGDRASVQVARQVVACAAALATTDTANFFDMPANAVVVGGYLKSDDMDTNGSPSITINVGDSGSATRFFSASTVAQAGTAAQESLASGLGYKFASKTRVTAVAQANAATGAGGNLELCLLYVVED